MKALIATTYGPPETLAVAEVPTPEPGPGQILVRIAAVSINPADVLLPGGVYRDQFALNFPHIPGNDFAGTVTTVGAGVAGYAVGDEIFGTAIPRALRALASPTRPSLSTGALAEYAVFEADTPLLTHRPPGLSVADAAALGTVGMTACALLGTGAFQPGETALVIGATGGVGTAVVPMLAAAGVHVIATATPADAELLSTLGAAEVIHYRDVDTSAETLRRYPSGVDVVLNLTLPGDDLTSAASALRPGGRLLTITFPVPGPDSPGRDDVTVQMVLDMEGVYGGMAAVAELAAAGTLPATISRHYQLNTAAQACADFANKHNTGKLVVSIA